MQLIHQLFLELSGFSLERISLTLVLSTLWAMMAITLAGYSKRRFRWYTGYSRKIFHFFIFFGAALVQAVWGFATLCLFGFCTSLVIFYSLVKGADHLWYEGIAREKDAPHRTRYVVIPYLATLLGGLMANWGFGSFAIVGYLVTGLGDAIGEPVGLLLGRHHFQIPTPAAVPTIRSLEGSTAVWIGSTIAVFLGLRMIHPSPVNSSYLLTILLIGLLSVIVEAFSPHGWDNFTLQIIPTALSSLFFPC